MTALWEPTRLGHFTYDRGDPFVRTYSLGDDAARRVVPLAREAGTVAVDLETDGLAEDSYTVKVIIVSTDTHACVLDGFNPVHRAAAKEAFDVATELDFHNSPFDVPPLVASGAMTLDHIDKVVDTLIWANMAITGFGGGRSLEDLEQSVLGVSAAKAAKDRFKQWAKINKMKIGEAFKRVTYADPAYTMYAGWDGIVTRRLRDPLLKMVVHQLTDHPFGKYGADTTRAYEIAWEQQIVNRVTLRRTARGLAVDPPRLSAEQERLMELQSNLEQVLRAHGVERPTNPGDLISAIKEDLPEDYPWTKGGKNTDPRPSTAGENLEKLDHPAAVAFMEYGDNNRLLNYLEKSRIIAERTDGRLHPAVSIMKAVTGRTSYSLPALQQFIATAREMILADEGDRLTSLDWSQIEPVILANLAGDREPLAVYEESGDLYTPVSEAAGVSRTAGKVGLLSTSYGAGVKKIASSLGISIESAQDVQDRLALAMPRSWNLIAWSSEWSRITGKTWTLGGRIVDVHPMFAYRGTNYTIQGSGYDLLSNAIVEMYQRGMTDAFYLSFHDELIVSESAAGEVREIMETPPERLIELTGRVPVLRTDRADLGQRWRTPPKNPCRVESCTSDKALKWMPEDDWTCGAHR